MEDKKMNVILLIAAVCSCAARVEDSVNKRPCQSINNRKAVKNFERNHFLPENFDTSSKSAWQRHISRKSPTQTFIEWSKTDLVRNICNGGGWSVEGNLCTSFSKIPMYVVKTLNGKFQNVKLVSQSNVIVACDKVGEMCLPVHLHGENQIKSHPNVTCRRPPLLIVGRPRHLNISMTIG